MATPLTVTDIGLILLCLALLVLIGYGIALLRALLPSAKSLEHILKDTEEMSARARRASEHAEGIVSNLGTAAGDIGDAAGNIHRIVRGNQSRLTLFTNFVNALTALRAFMSTDEETIHEDPEE